MARERMLTEPVRKNPVCGMFFLKLVQMVSNLPHESDH